jgi:hypothetical protein
MGVPPQDWLDLFPLDQQVALVAHLVQHAADAGTPESRAAMEFARQVLGPAFPPHPDGLKDLYAPQRRAAGAVARLYAVTGRKDDARELQFTLARLAFGLQEYGDVSRPLSEAFRLAGVTDRRDVFAACDELRDRLAARTERIEPGASFMDLAWARAAVLLDMGKEGG